MSDPRRTANSSTFLCLCQQAVVIVGRHCASPCFPLPYHTTSLGNLVSHASLLSPNSRYPDPTSISGFDHCRRSCRRTGESVVISVSVAVFVFKCVCVCIQVRFFFLFVSGVYSAQLYAFVSSWATLFGCQLSLLFSLRLLILPFALSLLTLLCSSSVIPSNILPFTAILLLHTLLPSSPLSI